MAHQPEQELEDKLVAQLVGQKFQAVHITNVADLRINLKTQLEALNAIKLSDNEFSQIRNSLAKGNAFDKAKTLRDRLSINRDDGTNCHIRFLDSKWSKNNFQVTQQVTVEGSYRNRYDVTILINGLPLIQVELKRRGLELKEAFNQINRYQRHSYWAEDGLFQYVQVFVITNGVNTKYYANNKSQSFKQTFYWADSDSNRYTDLTQFAAQFFQRETLSHLIQKYLVLNEADRILMVMRPYQIYATQAIVERVKQRYQAKGINGADGDDEDDEGNGWNGYIWHTTGSGKTLTSFKTAQILTAIKQVHKVVFVVDRKDLDYQTAKEFNSFSQGCVDSTDNTKLLVDQLTDAPVPAKKANKRRNTKLVVTTIQKLNNAITNKRYQSRMSKLANKAVVFIFDECHRSQFGDIHTRITQFFTNHQLFGFTGTPIFVDNALTKASRKYTTKYLFDKCLHRYTIVDAIKDENVLKFSIEYVGRYKKQDSDNEVDIDVEGIDTKELMESPKRLEKIADYILAQHSRKTRSKAFTAMFCVSSVATLIQYYEILQRKQQESQRQNLRIATIFSYTANEEDQDANGMLEMELDKVAEQSAPYQEKHSHSRDKLEQFIGDYNALFETKFTTKDSESFYNYYKDISKKVRERKIDILLVVNMFLTGFDSKTLNTLYVDKNLKHHGLIQAYSRTNRILNEQKSQGNIVVFRNLKKATDEALALFSNNEAKETVIMPNYDEFVRLFNKAYGKLLAIAPDLDCINELKNEEQELEFIKAFRELMRLKNILASFTDFSYNDLKLDEQEFEDYKSKYLDLYDKVRTDNATEKVSILQEVDFELELIQRDEINVAYILKLLATLKGADNEKDYEYQYKSIMQLFSGSPELRSKQMLIDTFIKENLDGLESGAEVQDAFDSFWEIEKEKATEVMCKEENLIPDHLKALVERMIYTNQEPLREDIFAAMGHKPKLMQRDPIFNRVSKRLSGFVSTFYRGM
ncbi:MAG: type I deoxyribonuclease HsdR [Desulfobacteraceae bacterium 4572_35.1]|nr:MAG: type I deoxyribonuclease HsdR [Desulfobacteraceae bacterium 4572_35.1]